MILNTDKIKNKQTCHIKAGNYWADHRVETKNIINDCGLVGCDLRNVTPPSSSVPKILHRVTTHKTIIDILNAVITSHVRKQLIITNY